MKSKEDFAGLQSFTWKNIHELSAALAEKEL